MLFYILNISNVSSQKYVQFLRGQAVQMFGKIPNMRSANKCLYLTCVAMTVSMIFFFFFFGMLSKMSLTFLVQA